MRLINFLYLFVNRLWRYALIIYQLIVTRERFTDIHKSPRKQISEFIKWRLNNKSPTWPRQLPIEEAKVTANLGSDNLRVTFVSHSTFLIQFNGINILTDPVWSKRVGPASLIGPKRIVQPGITFAQLPKIDLVLISHNHYDHLDIATIRKLWHHSRPQFILPTRNCHYLRGVVDKGHIQTLGWYEYTILPAGLKIHMTPAKHWSGRFIADNNYALWGNFIIEEPISGRSVAFLCDTGYDEQIFKQIGKSFSNIQLSIIPIGAYEPRKLMRYSHINPEEAVLIHQDLKSNFSVASHFHTFKLSAEAYDQPEADLQIAKLKHDVKMFVALNIGQAIDVY